MRRTLIAPLLCLIGVADTVAAQPTVPRRFLADSSWLRRWSVGVGVGKESGTFVEPRQVIVTGNLVVALDRGTREVRAFDARSGQPRFTMTAKGLGPGEFKMPALIATTPSGFVVLDHASARLTAFGLDGRSRWDASLPDAFRVAGICAAREDRFTVLYTRRDSAVVDFDTAGRALGVRTVPWKVRHESNTSFANTATFSEPDRSGRCSLLRFFGREWAVLDAKPGGAARVYDYVEPGKEPIMKVSKRVLDRSVDRIVLEALEESETEGIAKASMWIGDTIAILGAITSQAAHRMLDLYDGKTGRYLTSRKLPLPFTDLTTGPDGTYYATFISENDQAVLAIKPAPYRPNPPARTPARRPPPAAPPPPASR